MPDTIAEKIYYKMPIFMQNGIFSIYGFSLYRKRYNHRFHQYLDWLKHSEWWSESGIKEYQDNQIYQIVKHAYNTVPFYKRWYKEHGVNVGKIKTASDLKYLPILTKDIVRRNQHEMIPSFLSARSLIKNLTSGTTGTPLTIYQTPESLAFQWAIWWRHKARFGLSIKDRHLMFGARIPIDQNQSEPPFWRSDYFNHRVYLSTYHIKKSNIGDIISYLNSTYFDFFTGYPSAMYVFASLIEESGLRLDKHPRYVVAGSDALLPGYETVIGRVFGAPVTEQYGMAEFAGNMSKCEHGQFHVDFECCYVEPKPMNGSDFNSLIFTGWGNRGMPFIRYQIGDYGVPSEQPCPCGRKSQTFSSIDGRLEDFVYTPDGRKLIGMNQVFEYATHAREIQLYQERLDTVEFKIVPRSGFGDEDKQALIREFRRRAGNEIKISFSLVDQVERTASGKLKAVVSRVSG